MGKSLHVRNLDEGLVRRLKLRAAANNRSMEAEHRAILTEVLRSGPNDAFETRAEKLRSKTADRSHTPAEVLVRQSRDEAR